jgi:predicted secreted protein
VLLALAIGGAAACGGRVEPERADPSPSPSTPAPVRTNERATNGQAGTPIDARVGEEFVIGLRGNRTTGYRWELAEPVDSSVVVLVGHRYQPDAAPPPARPPSSSATFRPAGAAGLPRCRATPSPSAESRGPGRPYTTAAGNLPPFEERGIMRAKAIAGALAVLIAAAGCGREPAETDANAPVRAKAGETVEVFVRSNPSTGYEWSVTETPDTSIVALAGKRHLPKPRSGGRNGVGGTDRWTFTARRPGRTQVLLGYARPWEKVPPIETRRFTFVVE